MDSDDILARMREVRIAQETIRSAQGRLNAPMSDADRLIRGAGTASVAAASLVGGAASGADGRISARLNAAAEGGRRFKQHLQDAYAQMSSRIDELDREYEYLEIELRAALERESSD